MVDIVKTITLSHFVRFLSSFVSIKLVLSFFSMENEREGSFFPKLPDAAPDDLRDVHTRMASLAYQPYIRELLLQVNSDPFAIVPVPGAEDGVIVTNQWVAWLKAFERHAQMSLNALGKPEVGLLDAVHIYLRRERKELPPDFPPAP